MKQGNAQTNEQTNPTKGANPEPHLSVLAAASWRQLLFLFTFDDAPEWGGGRPPTRRVERRPGSEARLRYVEYITLRRPGIVMVPWRHTRSGEWS